MLSKKYYEMVARVINTYLDYWEGRFSIEPPEKVLLKKLANEFAYEFKQDNPRFDKAKFLKACGFGGQRK